MSRFPASRSRTFVLTFNIDAKYQVMRTQYTHNVVGLIEGSDPRLKDTYVAFGAHYDHVGYAEGEVVQGSAGQFRRRAGARGRVNCRHARGSVWNGADDDGSGTVADHGQLAKPLQLGQSLSDRLFLFGTRARRKGCGARASLRTIRPSQWIRSSRRSTWIWSGATGTTK